MTRGDEELLRLVAQGDSVAFAELYDRFSPRVFGLALRLTADRQEAQDVLQEVFLELWKRAPMFDAALGSGASWILMIARGRSIDHIRKRSRERNRLAGQMERQPGEGASPQDRDWLDRTVPGLAPELREVVQLAYANGLTREQIAAVLGIPVGTVKSRLRAAIAKMADGLHERKGAEP